MSSIVYKNFERERRRVVNEFESHPVTKELEMGPDAYNVSGTTNGIGNLYSFIGFPQGANPVDPVRKLMMGIKISRRPQKTVISRNKIETCDCECFFKIFFKPEHCISKNIDKFSPM